MRFIKSGTSISYSTDRLGNTIITGDGLVFHIHIPRTGGRFVQHLLQENGYISLDAGIGNYISPTKLELCHADMEHQELMFGHSFKSFKRFGVVRDPIDRFKSGLGMLMNSSGATDESELKELFDNFHYYQHNHVYRMPNPLSNIDDHITYRGFVNAPHGFFKMQSHFIDPINDYCYRYEDGLDDNFFNWLNDVVGLEIDTNKVMKEFDVHVEYDKSYDIDLPDSILEELRNMYKDDFELFNY